MTRSVLLAGPGGYLRLLASLPNIANLRASIVAKMLGMVQEETSQKTHTRTHLSVALPLSIVTRVKFAHLRPYMYPTLNQNAP